MEKYSSVLIIGLAASGEAAARLLLQEGTSVIVMDRADTAELRERKTALAARGARVYLGRDTPPPEHFSVCIVSPGVPADSALINGLKGKGIPVISELELGWGRADCRCLAVTGSNGKSTLAKLCAEALKKAGLKVALAGNYGTPVSQVALEAGALDWLVLEVSSFQLETVQAFKPQVGILLNLFPNHLDRHGDFASYAKLKARMFSRMTKNDTGIVFQKILPGMIEMAGSGNRWISFGLSADADFQYHSGSVFAGKDKISLSGTIFDNDVLGLSAAAAAAAANVCGLPLACLAEALRDFRPLAHRMQELTVKDGVRFVDDSKATNLAALMAALKMVPGPVHLIAGGLPKHESYEPARALLTEKVVGAYLIGTAADAMEKAWRDAIPCVRCATIDNAVNTAWGSAEAGATILLSPGCASFDQFRNFEQRGECFSTLVSALKTVKK